MRVTRIRANVLRLEATSEELSALTAGARMALDVLRALPSPPEGAADLLARVLADYDAGLARVAPRRSPMHVQIVTFHLADMTTEGYRETCEGMAPGFADLPGLLAKLWLADPDSGTYGGIYLFRDREAMGGLRGIGAVRDGRGLPPLPGHRLARLRRPRRPHPAHPAGARPGRRGGPRLSAARGAGQLAERRSANWHAP